MKKYFAKYLPVKGEIKEGELVMHTPTGSLRIYRKTLDITGEIYKYDKPIKLFLCSRDIQVGDKYEVQDVSGNRFTYICIKKDGNKIYYGDITYDTEGYKVIGEISPEAKWVKEGDEFDYQEVRTSYSCEKGDECDLFFGEQICSAPHEVLDLITIKCPCCGTFK